MGGIPLTSTSGIGLAVCMAEGRGLVEWIDPDGPVAQWNSAVAPEMQVDVGDRIDGFHVKGMKSMKKLIKGNEFLDIKNRAVVLQFTKPSIYTVKGKAPYGIQVKRKRFSDLTFFVVNSVLSTGSIEQWNNEFPHMQVSVGDVVREVNGVEGSSSEVQMMLASSSVEEKDLLVFHYPDLV